MGIRTHAIHEWNYTVEVVGDDGGLMETLALAGNFNIADAAFEAARNERSWSTIRLCNKGRVVKTAKTGGYDMATRRIEQIE